MVFSSLEFIFIFLPVFMIAYALSKKDYRNFVLLAGGIIAGYVVFHELGYTKLWQIALFVLTVLFYFWKANSSSRIEYQNLIIFTGSVIFYSLGVKKPIYILLFLLTNLLNYIVAQFIENSRHAKKPWLLFGVIFNFWWLIFFKYWSFGTENINALFHTSLTVKDIILPFTPSRTFRTSQTFTWARLRLKRISSTTALISVCSHSLSQVLSLPTTTLQRNSKIAAIQ